MKDFWNGFEKKAEKEKKEHWGRKVAPGLAAAGAGGYAGLVGGVTGTATAALLDHFKDTRGSGGGSALQETVYAGLMGTQAGWETAKNPARFAKEAPGLVKEILNHPRIPSSSKAKILGGMLLGGLGLGGAVGYGAYKGTKALQDKIVKKD